MHVLDHKSLPASTTEYLTVLQNIQILKDYQQFVREEYLQIAAHIQLIPPERVMKFIVSNYQNHYPLQHTIILKNNYAEHLRKWEEDKKINSDQMFSENSFLDCLKKIGTGLKAAKMRLN